MSKANETNNSFKQQLLDYCKDKNIPVSSNSSVDTIIKKISEFENNVKQLNEKNFVTTDLSTKNDSLEKQANKLIRCRIVCHNPAKNKIGGEIISVGNSVIPEQRKFIKYDTPYHISQLMYNVLKEKTFTRFKTVNTQKEKTQKAFQAKEYAIEILPPLTSEEFEAIRQRQLLDNKDNDED